jgi:hypothetical protein
MSSSTSSEMNVVADFRMGVFLPSERKRKRMADGGGLLWFLSAAELSRLQEKGVEYWTARWTRAEKALLATRSEYQDEEYRDLILALYRQKYAVWRAVRNIPYICLSDRKNKTKFDEENPCLAREEKKAEKADKAVHELDAAKSQLCDAILLQQQVDDAIVVSFDAAISQLLTLLFTCSKAWIGKCITVPMQSPHNGEPMRTVVYDVTGKLNGSTDRLYSVCMGGDKEHPWAILNATLCTLAVRVPTQITPEAILAPLTELARSPRATALTWINKWGSCVVCGLKLKSKDEKLAPSCQARLATWGAE